MKSSSIRYLVLAASLAALSSAAQIIHIGYQIPVWGMWLDIVAVFWFVTFFLIGVRYSLLVAAITGLIITFFTPDTWIGAGMKLSATLPVLFAFFLWNILYEHKKDIYRDIRYLFPPVASGLIFRTIIVLPLNYFLAIPFWTGLTASQAWQTIPWYIIVLTNIIQGLIDIIFAWILVYKFRLNRYN